MTCMQYTFTWHIRTSVIQTLPVSLGTSITTPYLQLYAQQHLRAHNSSCTSCYFLLLLQVTPLSLLPRTPHSFSPYLANHLSFKTQFTCHIEDVFLDAKRIRCLACVPVIPVHFAVIIIPHCFKMVCLCVYLLVLVTKLGSLK